MSIEFQYNNHIHQQENNIKHQLLSIYNDQDSFYNNPEDSNSNSNSNELDILPQPQSHQLQNWYQMSLKDYESIQPNYNNNYNSNNRNDQFQRCIKKEDIFDCLQENDCGNNYPIKEDNSNSQKKYSFESNSMNNNILQRNNSNSSESNIYNCDDFEFSPSFDPQQEEQDVLFDPFKPQKEQNSQNLKHHKSSFQMENYEINLIDQDIQEVQEIDWQEISIQKKLKSEEKKKQNRLQRNYIWFFYYNFRQDLLKNPQFQKWHKSPASVKSLQDLLQKENISSHEKLRKLCSKLYKNQQKEILEDLLSSLAFWVQVQVPMGNSQNQKLSFLENKIKNSERLKHNKENYAQKIPKFVQELEVIFQQYLC